MVNSRFSKDGEDEPHRELVDSDSAASPNGESTKDLALSCVSATDSPDKENYGLLTQSQENTSTSSVESSSERRVAKPGRHSSLSLSASAPLIGGISPLCNVNFNAIYCQYRVVIDVAKRRGWRVIQDDDEDVKCQVHWIDDHRVYNSLPGIKPGMRVNHFPGMFEALGRKSCLARNMARMQRRFAAEYWFLPKTWVLPHDLTELENSFSRGKIFIVKPDRLSQGKGIYLSKDLDEIKGTLADNDGSPIVVQEYISKPLLIDGFKFDLRLYLLVCGVVSTSGLQLQCFLFKDGLVRLCTVPYEAPAGANFEQRCMHLTNYAINKRSEDFQRNLDASNDGTGSKRSFSWLLRHISEKYGEEEQARLWSRLGGLCVKMIAAVEPELAAQYASTFPKDITEGGACRCFQILGVDVMLNDRLKPFLIEVNTLPSFETGSPLDTAIKERVISQSLDLSCASLPARRTSQSSSWNSSKGAVESSPSTLDCENYGDFERIFPAMRPEKLVQQCDAILNHVRNSFQASYVSPLRQKTSNAQSSLRASKLGQIEMHATTSNAQSSLRASKLGQIEMHATTSNAQSSLRASKLGQIEMHATASARKVPRRKIKPGWERRADLLRVFMATK